MKKKTLALLLSLVFALTMLAGCGGGSGAAEPADTDEPEVQAEQMDSGAIVELVFGDMGISVSKGSDIQISLPDDDGNVTVTFKISDQDCKYVVNGSTGEIISKDIPEGALEAAKSSGDPMEEAINASFEQLDGYNGGAENISVSQDGTNIIVNFDWNGEHYTFTYDTNEHKIVS